jgi:hypothetical protein
MSNSTRTDTLVTQAIRVVKKNKHGSAKTRHNHIKEVRKRLKRNHNADDFESEGMGFRPHNFRLTTQP